jgi:phosphoglycolate phosphatase
VRTAVAKSLLVCDLDGTLVDSYPGVAEAFELAFARAGIVPLRPIDRSIVGPPLDELIASMAGTSDLETLRRLRAGFIESYDGGACMRSKPFDGVSQMLTTVRSQGHELALATNKRSAPTHRILELLGWLDLFGRVETVDSRPGGPRSKTQMLTDIRTRAPTFVGRTYYLGDMEADVAAAKAAGIPCILATWGYEAVPVDGADFTASTPQAIANVLAGQRHPD